MYVEICDSPMKTGDKWVIGYHAGRVCGNGRFGYVIYGEPTRKALTDKLDKMGYKYF